MTLVDGAQIWLWHGTHGIPLEISIPLLAQEDIAPTWDSLIDAAIKDGANVKRLGSRLMSVITDSYTEYEIMNEKMVTLLKRYNVFINS